MSAVDDAAKRLVGLESDALDRLNSSLDDAMDGLVPDDLQAAERAIQAALYGTFASILVDVRTDAAGHFSELTGADAEASGADDSERATKASDYCTATWSAAMSADYAKSFRLKAIEDWEAALAIAREAVGPALRNAAAYEVAKAWNDEHRLALISRPGLGYEFHWYARADGLICDRCSRMDGKTSDAAGDFLPEGWPPLHGHCRCLAMPEPVKPTKGLRGVHMTYDGVTKDAGMTLVSKALVVKRIDEPRRTADFVASTADVDHSGDIVEQDWDFSAFAANPVAMFQHDHDELPIGLVTAYAVKNGQLECTIQFSTEDLNPDAEKVWRNVKAGVLRAVSVGFIPGDIRWEQRDGRDVYVFSKNKLLEISVVAIPCNPNALAKMKSKAFDAAKAARTESTTPELTAPSVNTDAAEKAATEQKIMSEELTKALDASKAETKALTEKIAELETRAAEAEAKSAALTAEKAAFEAQTKALADARDAAVARADAAEGQLIELEVEALVGKSITPAEKPLFVDLRKGNPELFTKMIEQRKPLNLTEPVIAGKDEGQGVAKTLGGDAGAEFLDRVKKLG
jgi:HK97 family phage prohead protease